MLLDLYDSVSSSHFPGFGSIIIYATFHDVGKYFSLNTSFNIIVIFFLDMNYNMLIFYAIFILLLLLDLFEWLLLNNLRFLLRLLQFMLQDRTVLIPPLTELQMYNIILFTSSSCIVFV